MPAQLSGKKLKKTTTKQKRGTEGVKPSPTLPSLPRSLSSIITPPRRQTPLALVANVLSSDAMRQGRPMMSPALSRNQSALLHRSQHCVARARASTSKCVSATRSTRCRKLSQIALQPGRSSKPPGMVYATGLVLSAKLPEMGSDSVALASIK